jgi:hypothetical protein
METVFKQRSFFMTPELSLPTNPAEKKSRQSSAAAPLAALLVIPIPKYRQPKRSLWRNLIHDLSYILPVFGAALGLLLALGPAPFIGATMMTVCPIIVLLRIHVAFTARRERKRIEALEQWYRERYLSNNCRPGQK